MIRSRPKAHPGPEGLAIEGLTVRRGRRTVLADVTLRIARGRMIACLGANGAGKSTLLSALAGRLPSTGQMLLDGQAPGATRIGHMPQHCRVEAQVTALEVLLLGRHDRLGWRVRRADLDAAGAMLEALGLSGLAGRPMTTLSGGQQQMVLLGQRLMRRPQLLLLDESTSALDIAHQMRVTAMVRTYIEANQAIAILAMHDLNLAARCCDGVLLLHAGRLEAEGSFAEAVTGERLTRCYGVTARILPDIDGATVVVPLAPAADRIE